MTGDLKNLPKAEQYLSILWKRSAVELQSISVHYERLKTCPDRLHWCCVSSTSTVLPPLVSFCTGERKKFMLLLHLLLSFSFYSNPGPRTTRPSCHFLGLYESASSFSEQKKPSAHLRFVALADPHISHIPKWKQKARPLPKNVINISCCMQHRRMRWGGSRMWDLASRGRGGFLLSFRRTPVAKYHQHVWAFPSFFASCMMKEQSVV